ncbi:MAG: hypothetical protein V4724_41065 [Pseudomonadota bacterium]
MHTITITEEVTPPSDLKSFGKPVIVTVETGDHLVITRKVDRTVHRAALRKMLSDMNAREFDATKETGKAILDEIRNRHG